ncbi:MAG TPA: prolyl oligopeptidase family serine peptidase [Rhizomicrobium sp.]|nr:prolyl oligopeptidase family serine peptidase [Rhizomicrobium sp.]
MIAKFVLAAAFAAAAATSGHAADFLAPIGLGPQPPAPKSEPVTETLYGVTVTDPYRQFEKMGPETVDWMKAQGAYTRAVFDSIEPRAALEKRIADFSGSFGFVQQYQRFGGRAFYEYRAPGSDNFDLMVSDKSGTRKLIDIAAMRAKNGDKPFAINYFTPSPDGSKVAAGISEGGSEEASITVYDAATGKKIAGPVDRANFGAESWSADSTTLYFNRLKPLAKTDPETEKYRDTNVEAWDLKHDPVRVLGNGSSGKAAFGHDEAPVIVVIPGARYAAALGINGVQNEWRIDLAPASKRIDAATLWKPFVTRDDGVTGADMRGGEIFLLSHKDAPTFQVLSLKAGEPLSSAKVLVPVSPNRLVESIHAAKDALYVLTREGLYSHLLRIPAGTTKIEDIALPYKGTVSDVFTDPRVAGATFALESWNVPPTQYSYNPKTGKFTDLKLGVHPAFDPADFTVSDLEARAKDGTLIPLSLLQPKDAKNPGIVLMQAYGSYGISLWPAFSPRAMSAVRQGIDYATCHVRGGGELGEQWRLAGKDANKPNTWRDLIACAEDLIARGVTSKDKLFIFGGSAGGITMGMSMIERPELFAGVIDAVPATNTLRDEFSPNGPPNIPEFGTITTEQGFKNLYAMDSYQHVKDGVTYPPILITTGLNDPRVSPWEPAKLAARLLASGTPNPVLLRVELEAGHGIGSTKTQNDELYADVISFIFWRAGLPEWQPKK